MSLNKECHVIGVYIERTSIIGARLNKHGKVFSKGIFHTTQPLMPGASTVELSALIAELDPKEQADLVVIGLQGKINLKTRVILDSIHLSSWVNVPLAAWLEPRVKKKVSIVDFSKSKELKNVISKWMKSFDHDYLLAFIAAFIGFNCFESSFKSRDQR